ncbi:MAG TPA: hypothetical protein VHG70_01655 [Nocardioidaceae bacterium]|nr:hypothetical protein [Nocardioidaceae bacterium]
MRTMKISATIGAVALAGSLLAPATAVAGGSDREEIRTGACSGLADWKIKVSPENGRLEVEYEVDVNRRGQRWQVRLFHGGRRIHSDVHRTRARSGSFTVRALERNTAGGDGFRARAVRLGGDQQKCAGRVRF